MEYQELEPELAKKYFDHLSNNELQRILNHLSGGAQINLRGHESNSMLRLKQEVMSYINDLLAERALLT